MSALCEKTGVNIDELSKTIGMDHRIGPHFFEAYIGIGGSYFQKNILNLVYLCKYYGIEKVAEYWHQVIKINDYQKHRFTQKIIDYFGGDLSGKKIAVLGWAFKANTNDSRESAAIFVAEKLYNAGATLEIYDPVVPKKLMIRDINSFWKTKTDKIEERIFFLKTFSSFHRIEAVAILTEWEELKNIDFEKLKVFDGRSLFKKAFYRLGT